MPAPAHEPTAATRGAVESMAAYGIPQADIARSIGIDPKTLRKHYAEEIETAAAKANARVAQTLYKIATDPTHKSCASAAMFWAKARMGWREAADPDVGKKEQRQEAAEQVASGGRFAPRSRPNLVVNNK